MSSARRSGAVLLGVVGAGVLGLWFRFNVAPGEVASRFPHDLVYYFLPQLERVGERLAAGELPLWNPDPCTGLPLLASMQIATFYPTTWLSALLPAERVLPIIVFAHWLLGGVGCALWLRTWGLRASLAAALGVVFVYACQMGQSFWPPMVVTVAWLPLLLLLTEHVMRSDRIDGGWLALVLATGLQILAGFPQLVVYGLQLVVPLAVLRGLQRAAAGSRRAAAASGLRFGAALLLGALVAMVQLGPSFEVLAASERAKTVSETEAQYLQSGPRLAEILENSVDPAPRLTSYELAHGAGYLGISTLVLAGLALVARRRDPLAWCLALAGVLWLVLADGYEGSASGLYRLYAMLPGVGLFRAPARLLSIAFLCFIGLAALGADAADRSAEVGAKERWLRVAAAAVFALVVATLGAPGSAWRAGAAAAWVAAAALAGGNPGLRRAWRAAGVVLIAGDVLLSTGAFGSLRDVPEAFARHMRAGPHEILSDAELARLRERAGNSRIEFVAPGRRIRPLMGIREAGGVHRLACYETLLPGQWTALSRRADGPDFKSAVMSNLDPERFPALFDAASVSFFVRVAPFGKGSRPHEVSVETNADALPRAYLVDRFVVVTQDEAFDQLLAGGFDVHREVLLDADPGIASNGSIERAIPATILALQPERVEIRAESPSDSLLVLTDTDAPGWRASVDGAPSRILRANGLFRAVAVPPGEHRVVFEYAPAGLRWGAALSGAGLLFALGAWAGAKLRRG